jgi:hypothetical protein
MRPFGIPYVPWAPWDSIGLRRTWELSDGLVSPHFSPGEGALVGDTAAEERGRFRWCDELPMEVWVGRSRWLYAGAVLVTIGVRLGSRLFARYLPWWLAKNFGDALYATRFFFSFGLVALRVTTSGVALAALGFCFAVQGMQLYQAPWLVAMH